MYSRLDGDDLGTTEGVDAKGRKAAIKIVSEFGLYDLILQSRKDSAKKFKRWITHDVIPQIRRTGTYTGTGRIPAFIHRYNQNWDRVAPGHFSILSECVIRLWGRLEQIGHIMADKAASGTENRPDVSVGRRFSDWLKKKHPEVADNYSMYLHWTPQGEFEVRQYPHHMWPLFADFLDTVWIPDHSRNYFKTRDPAALPHLPRLLPGAAPAPRRVTRPFTLPRA